MTVVGEPRLAVLEQRSPLAARLAELASLAVRVDAGLLRRLRHAFLREADVGIESDLWFSTIAESRSDAGFQIAPDLLAILRDRLVSLPGRPAVAEVREVLAEAHAAVSPAIRIEEDVNGIAVEKGDRGRDEIEERLRAPLRTLADGGPAALDIARWIFHAFPRLHPLVRETTNARTLALGSALLLHSRARVETLPEAGVELAELAWALPPLDQLTTKEIGVAFVPGALQFRDPAESAKPLPLPATDPPLVQIEWEVGTTKHRVLRAATPGVLVPLVGDPEEVTITALSGDRYEVRRAGWTAATPEATGWAAVSPPDELLRACVQIEPLGRTEPMGVAFAVEPGLLLAVSEIVDGYPIVGIHDSSVHLEVLRWGPGDSDEGHEDEMVGLRPVSDLSIGTTLFGDVVGAEEARAAVAGFVDGVARWFDVVLQPREASWRPRGVVLLDPPALRADQLTEAFAGAPVVIGDKVVGAVVSVLPPTRTSSPALRIVETEYLRSAVSRARRLAARREPGHRLRVFLSASPDVGDENLGAVQFALTREGHEVAQIESFGTGPGDPLRALDGAHLYVGIIGHRYGFVPPATGGPSVEERVYLRAKAANKPMLVFMVDDDIAVARGDDRALRFRALVDELNSVTRVREMGGLPRKVVEAVSRWQESSGAKPPSTTAAEVNQRVPYDAIGALEGVDAVISIAEVAEDRSLRFQVSRGDRQFVVRLDASQRRRVDDVLEGWAERPDARLGRRLFEPLLPGELRQLWEDLRSLQLVVDPAAASYPWELLRRGEPLALHAGMTRSWLGLEVKPRPIDSGGRALIIGEPEAPALSALPGATREVEALGALLRSFGYEVRESVRRPANDVLSALSRTSYEIVHFVGHLRIDRESGESELALGDRIFFGSGAFLQRMQSPPALFMVNGDGGASFGRPVDAMSQVRRPTAMSREVMEGGVHAFVGSAWTVTDEIASEFTLTLYRALLEGQPLGEASLAARRSVQKSSPGETADWAAYQCYGPPQFRLAGGGARA
jgi:hypothetical protein